MVDVCSAGPNTKPVLIFFDLHLCHISPRPPGLRFGDLCIGSGDMGSCHLGAGMIHSTIVETGWMRYRDLQPKVIDNIFSEFVHFLLLGYAVHCVGAAEPEEAAMREGVVPIPEWIIGRLASWLVG